MICAQLNFCTQDNLGIRPGILSDYHQSIGHLSLPHFIAFLAFVVSIYHKAVRFCREAV